MTFDWGRNLILLHNIMYLGEESYIHAKVLDDYKIQFFGSWSGNFVKIKRVAEFETKKSSFTLTFSVIKKQ